MVEEKYSIETVKASRIVRPVEAYKEESGIRHMILTNSQTLISPKYIADTTVGIGGSFYRLRGEIDGQPYRIDPARTCLAQLDGNDLKLLADKTRIPLEELVELQAIDLELRVENEEF